LFIPFYFLSNFGHSIVKFNDDGSEYVELSSGAPLDFPTSLAFGTGKEKHTLFITNFSVKHFLGDVPMPENAHPAVIALRMNP